MDNEREEEKEMKKISFNGNWVYHEGGGGALQSLMGGGRDTGKPVTLPHDALWESPATARRKTAAETGFLWRRTVITQRNLS